MAGWEDAELACFGGLYSAELKVLVTVQKTEKKRANRLIVILGFLICGSFSPFKSADSGFPHSRITDLKSSSPVNLSHLSFLLELIRHLSLQVFFFFFCYFSYIFSSYSIMHLD